jgi:hypothetical protein
VNSSGLLKLRFPHKNHFLDLLLGIALYLRDVYYICSPDHEHSAIPDYMEDSYMVSEDSGRLVRILKILSQAMDHTMK